MITVATTDTDLPAMPVDVREMHDMCEALDSGDLSPELRTRLKDLVIGFCSYDFTEPGSDALDAGRWQLARQHWRQFVAAWRAEHPLVETDAS